MPPAGFLARKAAIGELSPSGWRSSILVFGSSTKTTVTPWSGSSCGGADAGAEGVAVLRRGGGEVRDRDGDVVQATDHPLASPLAARAPA